MYDDKAWERFCDRMAAARKALDECETAVDEILRAAEERVRPLIWGAAIRESAKERRRMSKRQQATELLQHYLALASGKRSAAELSSDARAEIAEIVDLIIDAAKEECKREEKK